MRFFRRTAKDKLDETLFFLHIPKCAGTTLTKEIIKRKFKPHELIIFYNEGTEVLIEKLKGMPQKEQEKIKCIAGHFAFGIHNYYTARPFTYITLLRNPIERVISHYYYVLRKKDHYLHKTVLEKNLNLEEYVESKLSVELNNGQTRILAGIDWGAEFGKCPPAMLEQAKKNLQKHFTAVGISEKFSDFLQLLHDKLGWVIPKYKSKNISKNRLKIEDIDKGTLAVIEKYNRLDLELYRYGNTLFNSSFQNQGDNKK